MEIHASPCSTSMQEILINTGYINNKTETRVMHKTVKLQTSPVPLSLNGVNSLQMNHNFKEKMYDLVFTFSCSAYVTM